MPLPDCQAELKFLFKFVRNFKFVISIPTAPAWQGRSAGRAPPGAAFNRLQGFKLGLLSAIVAGFSSRQFPGVTASESGHHRITAVPGWPAAMI